MRVAITAFSQNDSRWSSTNTISTSSSSCINAIMRWPTDVQGGGAAGVTDVIVRAVVVAQQNKRGENEVTLTQCCTSTAENIRLSDVMTLRRRTQSEAVSSSRRRSWRNFFRRFSLLCGIIFARQISANNAQLWLISTFCFSVKVIIT